MELTRLVVMMVVMMVVVMTGHVRGEKDYVALQALRAKLLENYDKHTLPLNGQSPIAVNVSGLAIRNLYMDEKRHQVFLQAWLTYTWKDTRLTWDPEEHGGVAKLAMSPNDLWMPDLTVYNSGDAASTHLVIGKALVIVYPSGQVLQVPPTDMLYNCVADLTYWPHDAHHCKLKIGSWVHDGYTIDIILSDNAKPELEVTKEPEGEMDTMQWELASTSSMSRKEEFYVCCPEPYVTVETDLLLIRNAPAYTWLIKIPAVCFSLLTLVIFLLPPDAGEKITFGGVCLLLHLIFLVFAHDTVNSAPTHTPLIVQLVVVELVLVAASVVIAAMVVRVAKTPNTTSPPSFLTNPARSLASVLFLSAYANEASGQEAGTPKTDEVELGERGGSDKAERQRVAGAQWMLVGAFLDRLALLVCFIVILVVLGRFSTVI